MTIGNRPATVRADGRGPGELRPVTFTLGVQKWAEGSCRIRVGDTEVLCAATIADRVPPHLRGKGVGWVTAEYSMLPRATAERTDRESVKGRIGGRTHEIQRLIGRSLRDAVDLTKLGERTITIDCDVLQADGGTRTASITGGYVAPPRRSSPRPDRHLTARVAAVSVGLVDGLALLDLDYRRTPGRRRLQRGRHRRWCLRRARGRPRGAVRPGRRRRPGPPMGSHAVRGAGRGLATVRR
jgi:ribonuclease PH